MVYEPDAETRLLEAAYAHLGTRDPDCACGETHPLAMTGAFPNERCDECQLKAHGKSPIERQHPAGRRNDPAYEIPMPANPHRVWDAWKRTWPQRTLRNPEGSPLLRAAAGVRAFLDFAHGLLDRLMAWIPSELEATDAALTKAHGPRWWEKLDM